MSARLHTLANGVRVICDPMPGLESTALSVVIRGASRWEGADRSGWSHLIEHMVFKGAGSRSALQIVEAIEAAGGHVNAATGYERTSYQIRCLREGLELGMEIGADLVRRPTLDADDLRREIAVVGQEIAEAADTPDDRVFDLAQASAFAGQPLGRPILGSTDSIGAATVETLSAYHAALYAPDRIVVSVAGAVDEDQLLALAERHFGDARAPAETMSEPVPAAFVGGEQAETRRLEQAQLVLLLPGVSARDDDYFAIRLFAEILGGGMSSRLFQVIREDRGLAYAIDAYAETYEDTGVLGIYVGCAAADAAETARLSAEETLKLAAGPLPDELARAKAQAKAQLFMGRESPLTRAEQAAGQVLLFGHAFEPLELATAIDAVEAADLSRVGERALGSGQAAVAVLGPKRAAAALDAFRRGRAIVGA
ncbi:MAG TPA: pitrilysin family protein [Caulobacteraceae bacterium]|jgi:predicted Zn-dependent peptidase|nr:pitrilysin family protein [Caulobacteraceae bacterium]